MRKSRLQMNPAFAQAHGLPLAGELTAQATVGAIRLETAIKEARISGQLRLSNAGIELPNEIFELSASLEVNLSMESQQSACQHTEDTLTVVDLSDNDMIAGDFDERFTKFIRVQQLCFKRCQWSKIEVSLASLEFLRILDLAGNRLTKFDMTLVPPSLHELNLSGNLLDIITSTETPISTELQVLDISNNRLQDLSGCNISCPDLRIFRCHHNSLSKIPTNMLGTSISRLESIDCSYNMIDEVLDFSHYKSLKTLNMGMNRLSTIPMIPKTLLTLDVTENRVKDVTRLLSKSDESPASLIEMMLSGNQLSEIDGSIFENYSNLQRLDISSNKLKNLPYQLGFLNLRAFRVTSNPLFTFKRSDVDNDPNAILAILRRRAPKREEAPQSPSSSVLNAFISNGDSIVLTVSQQQELGAESPLSLKPLVRSLKANPAIATMIRNKLELHGFKSIPGDLISTVRDVSRISISANNLTSIPQQIGVCSRLVHLDLSRNQLIDLSPLLGDLKWASTIRHLDLSSNRFGEVPVEVLAQLRSLETLNLMTNSLKSISNCRWLPESLIHLELSENQIEDIGDLVWALALRCPNIEILRVAQNRLKKIPLELGLFFEGKLRKLDLRMNPQQAVRHSVLERACPDQLSYLKNRMTNEEVVKATKRLEGLRKTLTEETAVSNSSLVPKDINYNSDTVPTSTVGTLISQNTTNTMKCFERQASLQLIEECKERIDTVQKELDSNFSLSQAKRYALKKELAMEWSRMIKEERKLGLRNEPSIALSCASHP